MWHRVGVRLVLFSGFADPHTRVGEWPGDVISDEVLTNGRGIGHVPDTALPGERGNVGLAAHRDTYFRGLKGVAKGDRIRIDTPDGIFSYEVEWARIVDPDRIEVLADTVGLALTLVTCYPFNWIGRAPKRFVVRCRPLQPQVDPAPRQESDPSPAGAAPDAGTDPMDSVLDAPGPLPDR